MCFMLRVVGKSGWFWLVLAVVESEGKAGAMLCADLCFILSGGITAGRATVAESTSVPPEQRQKIRRTKLNNFGHILVSYQGPRPETTVKQHARQGW